MARYFQDSHESALFVGGPLDGRRMMVNAIAGRFHVQVPRPLPYMTVRDLPRPDDVIPIDTAVYMRTEVGARANHNEAHQYVLYVYAGIVGDGYPRVGDQIIFRGVSYTVAVKHYEESVRVAAKCGKTSILVAEKDLTYNWSIERWHIRDGASIEVRWSSIETTP